MSPFPDSIAPTAQTYTVIGVVCLLLAGVAGIAVAWIFLPPAVATLATAAITTFIGGEITKLLALLHNQQTTIADVADARQVAADTSAKVDSVHILVNNQRTVLEQRISALEVALHDAGVLTPPNLPPVMPPSGSPATVSLTGVVVGAPIPPKPPGPLLPRGTSGAGPARPDAPA